MKRIDFENGTVTGNILGAALPMLDAQILNLLYNIVDRIYIARIPEVGTAALGAVGLCFPLIVVITAFANLFGKRRRTALFYLQRKKEKPGSGTDHGHVFFHGLRQRPHSHGHRSSLCPPLGWCFSELPGRLWFMPVRI